MDTTRSSRGCMSNRPKAEMANFSAGPFGVSLSSRSYSLYHAPSHKHATVAPEITVGVSSDCFRQLRPAVICSEHLQPACASEDADTGLLGDFGFNAYSY